MKRELPEAPQLAFVRDADAGVRQRLASEARATRRVLAILAADPEPLVRGATIERLYARRVNPRCTVYHVDELDGGRYMFSAQGEP